MKDAKNMEKGSFGFFASAREIISEAVERRRRSPSVLFADICVFAVAFLFAR